jgi:hypothetical protein
MSRRIEVSQATFDQTRHLVDVQGTWRYALGPGLEPVRLIPPLHRSAFYGVDVDGLPVKVVPRPLVPLSPDEIASRALREAVESMPGTPSL